MTRVDFSELIADDADRLIQFCLLRKHYTHVI